MDSVSLRAIPFFQKLTDDELQVLAGLFETRNYKSGERILEEGAASSGFYIIVDGVVHVRRRANKREMLLTRLGPGSFFGEINLFDPGVATASIYAKKNSGLGLIPYERFLAYMEQHPHAGYRIASAILAEVAKRLRTTSARLANAIYSGSQPADGTQGGEIP